MNMIVVLCFLGAVGLTAIISILAKVKELHDWGYSWGYSFLRALGGDE